MTQQWDSTFSDPAGRIVLSGSPALTAQAVSAASGTFVGTETFSTGKFYWECTGTGGGWNSSDCGVGIADRSGLYTLNYLGSDAAGLGLFIGSGFYNAASIVLATPNLTSAAFTAASGLMCVEWDATNNLLYVRFGVSGNWNGNASANPATQTGGCAVPAAIYAGTQCPAGSMGASSADTVVAAFAQASWVGTPSSGFGPFDPSLIKRRSNMSLLGVGGLIWTADRMRDNKIMRRRQFLDPLKW